MSLQKTNKRRSCGRLTCFGQLPWVALLLLVCAADGWAGTGILIAKPSPKTRPTSRLQMIIDSSWVDSQGFRPVKVTFYPIGKRVFPADRNLVVELRPGRWSSPLDTRLEVSRSIELPEGAESASTTLYVPQDGTFYGVYAVWVYEDGKFLKDLSDKAGIRKTAGVWYAEDMPAMIFLSSDVPSIYQRRTVAGMRTISEPVELASGESIAQLTRLTTPMGYANANVPIETWLSYMWPQISAGSPGFEFMNPVDLPELLPGLSSVDLVLIERDELEQLAQNYPESFDLLRRWMLAGGNLCTTAGDDGFEGRGELETLFGIPSTGLAPQRNQSTAPVEPVLDGTWRYPNDWEYGSMIVEFRNMQRRTGQPEPKMQPEPPEQPTFALRRAQFGQLLIAKGDAFELGREDWNWLFKSIPSRMWKWEVRNGLTMNAANDGFWDFTVPGVGLPPVTAFQVLITFFALVIGPLNYLVLSRRRRLSWLMATVPLGSVVTILGLFAFAMFTDGISVRARVRSLTQIDQRTQHAVSFSRQSYYAGVAPADGLVYPEDAIVLPIDHSPVSSNSVMARKRRVIEHRGDVMHFKVGYLPSRTTVQYMVTRSVPTELQVEFATAPSGLREATNGLRSRIETLFYRDPDGELYIAEQIDAGATAQLSQIDEAEAIARLSEIIDEDPLQPPIGLDRSLLRDGLIVESWDAYGRQRSRHGNRSSPMERTLSEFQTGGPTKLNRNSYLAVVESCEEVPLGVQKCELRGAFHVVVGQL